MDVVNVGADKTWVGDRSDNLSVKFSLQYLATENEETGWKDFAPNVDVTLDGKIDASSSKPYGETSVWRAVWNGIARTACWKLFAGR